MSSAVHVGVDFAAPGSSDWTAHQVRLGDRAFAVEVAVRGGRHVATCPEMALGAEGRDQEEALAALADAIGQRLTP